MGDDEDAPEGQQHDPTVVCRVGLGEASTELGLERAAQLLGEGLQGRPRSGAADPREDGIHAGEFVQVGRLPGVDLPAVRRADPVVVAWIV